MHLLLVFSVLTYLFSACACGRVPPRHSYAEIINFNEYDLLDGDDGFQPHPQYPLKYGPHVLRVDDEGNGMEEHAAHVAFFEGKYYLYSETWACGRILYFSGRLPDQSPPPGYNSSQYPPGDNGGACGLATFSSTDLRTWTKEDLYYPESFDGALVSKPRVFWSHGLTKYVLWFHAGNSLGNETTLWVATGDGPAGPWSEPSKATGGYLSHDYAITIGPDGSGWIVTDVWAGTFEPGESPEIPGRPYWSLWVQKLNKNLTGTEGPATSVRIFKEAHWEAIGIFHRLGSWYIISGGTCSNCQANIKYIRAQDPLGPWFTEEGYQDEERLHNGNIISSDGCGSQAKGASILPSTEGPVVVTWGWAYRTSPSNLVKNATISHADNMQAISSQLWFRPEFDSRGNIKPYRCDSRTKIPLQAGLTSNTNQKCAGEKKTGYQPDCRVRAGTRLIQEFGGRNKKLRQEKLEFAVFQKTDDLGPFSQDGLKLNGPLSVRVEFEDGTESPLYTWASHNVSHAPEKISVASVTREIRSITLSTNATNGCYGVLVERKSEEGRYGVVRTTGGGLVVAAKAQLLLHQE